ncbi:hypothetical protein LOK49_LG09G02486 [Camellia lanceoleosa]|uniref:Uncharacterized protein n=1 Tax=Camellia lanceoleosa TaxID=1840588 RepID=A0ACC0GHI3_9ERIC|nr:hypothetical protein LOK49_LG09G02486 [Camellia lanceoleosa]
MFQKTLAASSSFSISTNLYRRTRPINPIWQPRSGNDEKTPKSSGAAPPPKTVTATATPPMAKAEDTISLKIYDAMVIREPMALGKDKRKVWDKLMNAKVVYLGEARQVPIADNKVLELEIVKNFEKEMFGGRTTIVFGFGSIST